MLINTCIWSVLYKVQEEYSLGSDIIMCPAIFLFALPDDSKLTWVVYLKIQFKNILFSNLEMWMVKYFTTFLGANLLY